MMRRRVVGRPVARVARVAVGTAVVAGTAGAVHHHQEQKYANQAAEQQAVQQQAYDQGAADAAAQQQATAPAAAPAGNDLNSQLMQLSQLHNSGVLSDEEFAQAKQKLLNG
jgi:hypothetical protein